MKEKKIYLISLLLILIIVFACSDDEPEIEYQEGYPNRLAGNWVVFEFPNADLSTLYSPYDMVTALDPNREGYVIIDNLYNSDIRVRAEIVADTGFVVFHGSQLNYSSENYGIESITAFGFVNDNPIIVEFVYTLALYTYPDMAFELEDIEDALYIEAGFYDQQNALVDSVLIVGYRKTGFEEVEY